VRRPLALLCLPLSGLALSACASTTSTAAFKGQQHEVAQTLANLQSHATAAEEKKICGEDLALAAIRRLGGAKRCEAAIKSQLAEVDSLEVTVESVQIASDGTSATAEAVSVHEGKKRTSTVALVKEGGKWRISALG
jgi:hypothetical protein